MDKSRFTEEEEHVIEQAFQDLLNEYAHTVHRQKVEIITQAFELARQAHQGVRRLSGEPYIMHPLAVAKIVVSEIGLGSTSICAALLHDVVEDTEYTVTDIEERFNPKIAQIVDGLTKISGGIFGTQDEKQAVNIRKLILTMSEDVRVVLIKLADRLHNMRTLEAQPAEKQHKIATETMYIYAPLAHRLGMFPIKSELEDLSFRYLHADTYKEISDKLSAIKESKMEDFNAFVKPIKKKLDKLGYQYTITARIKSIYSIWEKMQKKNIPFEDVYDLLATRIIFTPSEQLPEKDQCWMIYSAITSIYRPHPERIRDWVSTPKANGYEALHVTVMSPSGQWIEIQIRSTRMHELAEKGLAAHWKYKTDDFEESKLDDWLKDIKDILDHPEPDAMEFLNNFKLNLFAHEVFVFTPSGEIKTLPQGATILDFAYQIHSHLGDHCIGGKVNHKMVPLSYVLRSGDQVEILTSDAQQPEAEWLNLVTSAKAQDAIKRYFNRQTEAPKRRSPKPMLVTISVRGRDTFGVLVRILNIVSNQLHILLKSIYTETMGDMFECRMEIMVASEITVSLLCNELQKIQELTNIERVPNRTQAPQQRKSFFNFFKSNKQS